MTRNAFPFYENAVRETGASLTKQDGQFAEATIYDLLRAQLPPEWSFIWGVQLGVHEYDFLVLVPGRGIVNLECKGHGYTPIGATYKFNWYNRERNCIERRDVLGQAAGARKSYARHLQDALFGTGHQWGIMGFCVVFPLDEFVGVNFRGVPIYRKSECEAPNGLKDIVLDTLDRSERQLREHGITNPTRLSLDDADKIWQYWTQEQGRDELVKMMVPIRLDDYRAHMRALLTASQDVALNAILQSQGRRILVEGGAGTGKTFLAMAVVAHAKGRILYVCFNRVLASYMTQEIPANPRLTITNFHRLSQILLGHLVELARKPDESDADYWVRMDETFWARLKDMSPGEYPLYDMIVIDEAQDLTKTQLLILLRCCSSGGRVVMLADSEQALYGNRLTKEVLQGFLRGVECLTLRQNLRNPRPVKKYCDSIVPDSKGLDSLMDGPDVVHKTLRPREIDRFIEQDVLSRYNPSDVAVVSPRLDILSSVGKSLAVPFYGPENKKPNEIAKNLNSWRMNKCVWKSTTHAFKGLEAMAVVHLVPEGFSVSNLLYVGGSRAIHQLYIIEII